MLLRYEGSARCSHRLAELFHSHGIIHMVSWRCSGSKFRKSIKTQMILPIFEDHRYLLTSIRGCKPAASSKLEA